MWPSNASWLLNWQWMVEGHVPSNPVSQNGNLESAFFGTPCTTMTMIMQFMNSWECAVEEGE